MANYPSSLPVADPAGVNLASNPHSTLHDDMYDEIVAIATELGTLPKGTAASVKARLDALPLGVIEYASTTTAQTAIGQATTDVTSLTATWTASSTRLYRISFQLSFDVNRGGTGYIAPRFSIADGSNTLIRSFDAGYYTASIDEQSWSSWHLETGLSGSVTRKLRAAFTGTEASNNIDIASSSTRPAFILVEDVGPA